MAALTLDQLRTRLTSYLAAEANALQAVETGLGDRKLRLAELAQIRQGITDLQREIEAVEAAGTGGTRGPRISGITPGG